MSKRNYRLDFEVLTRFRTGEWAVQPTLGAIYHTTERRMLCTHKGKNGYIFISIPPERSHYPLSRAIWIGSTMNVPEFEDLEVDHINEIKEDNRFENLRLLTQRGNTRRSQAILTYEEEEEVRKRYAAESISQKKLGKEYGCCDVTIHNIIKRPHLLKDSDENSPNPAERLSRKTKEEIFQRFCVEGKKMNHVLNKFKITRDVLRAVIEEESLRTKPARLMNLEKDNKS